MAYRGVKEYLEGIGRLYSPKFESIWEQMDYLSGGDYQGYFDKQQELIYQAGLSGSDLAGDLAWDDRTVEQVTKGTVDYYDTQGVFNYAKETAQMGWNYIVSQGLDSKSRIAAAERDAAEFTKRSQEQMAELQAREEAAQRAVAEQEASTRVAQERAAAAAEQQRKSQIRLENTRGLSNAVGIKVGTSLDSRENRNAVQYQSAADQNRGMVSSSADLTADATQGPRKTRRGLSASLGINV